MSDTYAIKGGRSGRERLRLQSNVLQSGTNDFLTKIGIRPGMACLDVGCGGGDVSCELARRVGVGGGVIGLDMDVVQLDIIRNEATAQQFANIDYRAVDVTSFPSDLGTFDIVYSRYLLCHLPRRTEVLTWMVSCLKPGGVLALEDIDFSGRFCYPPQPAFDRYLNLSADVIRRRGGDPDFGLKLPVLVAEAGLSIGGVFIAHPADIEGDTKLLNAISMENYADSIVADGLATRTEVDQLIATMHESARDKGVFASVARRIQVWGRRAQ